MSVPRRWSIRFPLLLVLAGALVAGARTAGAQSAGSGVLQVPLPQLPGEVSREDVAAVDGLRYSPGDRHLLWVGPGWMPADVRDRLLAMSEDPAWQEAIRGLYDGDRSWRRPSRRTEDPDEPTEPVRFEQELAALPEGVIREDLDEIDGLSWSAETQRLVWEGPARMSEDVRDRLLDMSADRAWWSAVNGLYEQAKPTLPAEPRPYFGRTGMKLRGRAPGLLTLRSTRHDIRCVLVAIAEQFRLNIIVAPKVAGELRCQLENVPVRVALDAILVALDCDIVEIANPREPDNPVLLVVPRPAGNVGDDAHVTKVYRVADRVDFAGIRAGFEQLRTPTGTLVPNEPSRILFVRDTPDAVHLMDVYYVAVRTVAKRNRRRVDDDRR